MSLLILGSIALDTVKTPVEERSHLLGGAASYAAVAASFFTPPRLVGIVGEDFPQEHLEDFKKRHIDLEGLQIVPGKTFHWSGEYLDDMNVRETHATELNVFEHFTPTLPASYRQSEVVLLGNIAPELQLHVLQQLEPPHFVVADTMNLWINIARPALKELLGRIDMLLLNESEARELTEQSNLMKAGHALCKMGPRYVVIKKGEHGALLFGENHFFSCPAFPLEEISDPTGAGDAFGGGLAGYLTSHLKDLNTDSKMRLLREGMIYGSIMASFTVESFSLERLRAVTLAEIKERFEAFKRLSTF